MCLGVFCLGFILFGTLWVSWTCVTISRRRQWHPTPVLLPGNSHGRRSLVGCSPWGRKESDTTEQLHFYFSLSCIGEGNSNPLQCSCLENPRDGGVWWAAIYGVAQSQTRLKRLSSSSRDHCRYFPSGSAVKNLPQCRRHRRCGFDPWVRKILWRRAWQPTPVFLPGESQGRGSLVGCRLWGCTESDTTEAT